MLRKLVVAAVSCVFFASAAAAAPTSFSIGLDAAASAQPVSGRLLLFAVPVDAAKAMAKDGKIESVDASPFQPELVTVAAQEVTHLMPGATLGFDADVLAYPQAYSNLPAGDYAIQAVLDVNHDYNYGGRGAGDLISNVLQVHLPADDAPELVLTKALPEHQPWQIPQRYLSDTTRKHFDAARSATQPLDFVSPALSAFHGRPIHMRGWVLLPPGYDATARTTYPTVYFTHGFGGNLDSLSANAAMVYAAIAEKQMPPMIWVFLDESGPTGTHEFADSVNNGPWGKALTTELIPWLETHYRMDAEPRGRFLQGHSSGGWASLWLQVRYPKVFGGTWSTAPDPSDFHDFTGPDLYAPDANVYRKTDGTPWPLVRSKGKVIATFEQFARMERVLGVNGGQMTSFEWVFSPRGEDGRPMPMFDRDTGAVDPEVAAYWRDNYDIAHRLQTQWPQLKPDLDGKIHVIVGTADTFYLDGAAHRLKAVLDGLHADAEVRFVPERTHGDLYVIGDDPQGLLKEIAWEMYHVARPAEARQRATGGR